MLSRPGMKSFADHDLGAKGLVSLDSTLSGRSLRLRDSMIKFRGSNDFSLEINNAAYRPLTNYLNTQFVAILEDLGVPEDAFLALQQEAVSDLQRLLQTPINAAIHLERNLITAGQAPRLIRTMRDLRLDFRRDPFLLGVVEVVALSQIRDM